jgi:indolepyruvate ferredoxin oxidoreductase alpha subunit
MMEGPPFHLGQYKICMGAGIGAAQGLSHKSKDTPVIALIGDSTLFHAGLPSVLNAAYYDANVLLVVLENRWTAMTGHQPTPSTEETINGKPLSNIDVAQLLSGLGVKWIRTTNPFEPEKMEVVVKEALNQPGFKVIVVEGECNLQSARRNRVLRTEHKTIYQIDTGKCMMCDICFVDFGCPAIVLRKEDDNSDIYAIDLGLCTQCGACVGVCPFGAIVANPSERRK